MKTLVVDGEITSTNSFSQNNETQTRIAFCKLNILKYRFIFTYDYNFIHASAGFMPDEPYYIPRNISVPAESPQKGFTWLEDVCMWIRDIINQENIGDNIEDTEREHGIFMFLKMLRQFRSIVLQDLALLADKVPKSIYFQHPITCDPLFLQFKEEMKKKTREDAIFTEKHTILRTKNSDFGDLFEAMNSEKGNIEEKRSTKVC